MAWEVTTERDDPDPEDRVWTLTRRSGVPGWNTDGGYDGYGLTKAVAEWLARVANEAEARGDLAPPLEELSEYERDYGPRYGL
jgi:hypothetical protein